MKNDKFKQNNQDTLNSITNRSDLFILLMQISYESCLRIDKALQKSHLILSYMDSFKKHLLTLCEMFIGEQPSVKDSFVPWKNISVQLIFLFADVEVSIHVAVYTNAHLQIQQLVSWYANL